jgi:hypothetical protein
MSLQFCTKHTANEEVVDFKYDSIQTVKWNQICLSTISIAPVGCAYDKTEQGECLYCLVNKETEVNDDSVYEEKSAPFNLFIYKFVITGKQWQTDTVFEVPSRFTVNLGYSGSPYYDYGYHINDTVGIVRLRNRSYFSFGYSAYEYEYPVGRDSNYFSNLFDLEKARFSEVVYQRANNALFYPKNRYVKIVAHDSILKDRVKYKYLLSRISGIMIRDSTSDTDEEKAYLKLRKTNLDLTEDHIGENKFAESTLKPAYFKRAVPTSSECYNNEILQTEKFIIYNLENGVVLGYERQKNLYFPIVVQSLWRPGLSPRSISIKNNKLLVPFSLSRDDLLSLNLSTFKYSFGDPLHPENRYSPQEDYGSNGAAH